MNSLVRRTNLLVDPMVSTDLDDVWGLGADAITLDIRNANPEVLERASTNWISAGIRLADFGGSEVFIGVKVDHIDEQLKVLVGSGIAGVVLSGVQSTGEIARLAEVLVALENRWEIPTDSLQIIPVLETALGVWNVREIITASPRVTQVALDEGALCHDLGITPQEEYDPLVYARGRMVIEATALQVQPVGVPHPLGTLTPDLSQDQLVSLGVRAKDLGFKGALFGSPAWVEPLNKAFSPTQQQVEYYAEVREVFAEGVAQGTAAVPLRGRMVDVPVDEWAKAVLERADQCRARDQQKRQAMEKAASA